MTEREASGERWTDHQQADDIMKLPRVSVITPTYNRRDSLLATLRALAQQTVAPATFEVLVISDGSTDGSAEACEHLAAPYTLRYFEQDHQGPAAARNLGTREAHGELLVFLDDDVVPAPELIAVHLALYDQQPHSVGVGPLLPPPDMRLQPWVWWEEKMLLQQYDDIAAGKWPPTFRQFYTGNASVPRQDVLDVGGFDQTFLRAEDVELALRLRENGLHFHFLPDARALHYARRTFRSWFDIPCAYALADLHMASRPGQHWQRFMGGEFDTRHPILKQLAEICIGHPVRCMVAVRVCAVAARLFAAIPLRVCNRVSTGLFSIVFNLRYWQTLAEQLGTKRFWAIVKDDTSYEGIDEDLDQDQLPSVEPANIQAAK